MEESADDAAVAIDALPELVEQLGKAYDKATHPTDGFAAIVQRQHLACKSMTEHLNKALADSREALALHDQYVKLAKELAADLLPSGAGPIEPLPSADMGRRSFLLDTVSAVTERVTAGLAQAEREDLHWRGELTEREKQAKRDEALAAFQSKLRESAEEFKKTAGGAKGWANLKAIMAGDTTFSPDQAIGAWWKGVAEFAGVEIPAGYSPQTPY